jgi:transcription antitermination factor NusG
MQTGLARQPAREQKMHGFAAAQDFSANWFAAYTHSHHEKRVASHFGERQIEAFLPLYAARHRWKNRCEVNLELPLFPNYVFVRIDPRKRVRVLEVPGVVSLVGFGRTLAPLPDFEIEALRSGLGQRKIEPHPYLVIGERVRIKAGPMMGMEGVLVRKKNNFRVVLALDVIMQSVAVEVDADDLEPAAKGAGRVVLTAGFAGQPHQQTQACRPL